VLFPVQSRALRETILRDVLQVHLRDTVQARRLLPDGSYERLSAQPGDTPLASQAWMLQHWSSRPVAETRGERSMAPGLLWPHFSFSAAPRWPSPQRPSQP
jgi:polyphosphate kinase